MKKVIRPPLVIKVSRGVNILSFLASTWILSLFGYGLRQHLFHEGWLSPDWIGWGGVGLLVLLWFLLGVHFLNGHPLAILDSEGIRVPKSFFSRRPTRLIAWNSIQYYYLLTKRFKGGREEFVVIGIKDVEKAVRINLAGNVNFVGYIWEYSHLYGFTKLGDEVQ